MKLGGFGSERWSSQAFVESRVTSLRTRTTSTALVSRLMLLGADATKAVVPTGVIVDDIVGVGDVRQRDVTARMDSLPDALLCPARFTAGTDVRDDQREELPDESDAPEGVVRLTITAAVEPLPDGQAGRRLDWAGAAQGRECGLAPEPFGIIAVGGGVRCPGPPCHVAWPSTRRDDVRIVEARPPRQTVLASVTHAP